MQAVKSTLRAALDNPMGSLQAAVDELGQSARSPAEAADSAGGSALGSPRPEEEDDASAQIRARQQTRGRRTVVFSSVRVNTDASWRPAVVEKTEAERGAIESVITSNLLFGSLDADVRRVLIDAMVPKSFRKGDVVITQGDTGDFYYMVSAGTADISVNGKGVVLSIRTGSGFGELALLYDAPRAASVVVTSPTLEAWALDRETFQHVTISHVAAKRRQYEAFLSRVPVFATLTSSEVLALADTLEPVSFAAGEVVVRQGDAAADRFYVVETGELAGTMEGVEGEVCPRLTPGAYFGERALLTDAPRAATITAVVPSRCVAMDRAAFHRLLGPLQDLLQRNAAIYAQYVRNVNV